MVPKSLYREASSTIFKNTRKPSKEDDEYDEYKSDPKWISDAKELSKYLNRHCNSVWERFYDLKNLEPLYYENILDTIYLICDY